MRVCSMGMLHGLSKVRKCSLICLADLAGDLIGSRSSIFLEGQLLLVPLALAVLNTGILLLDKTGVWLLVYDPVFVFVFHKKEQI